MVDTYDTRHVRHTTDNGQRQGYGISYPQVSYKLVTFAGRPAWEERGYCTFRDTGKVWYDIYSKSIKACHTGVWKPVIKAQGKNATSLKLL